MEEFDIREVSPEDAEKLIAFLWQNRNGDRVLAALCLRRSSNTQKNIR